MTPRLGMASSPAATVELRIPDSFAPRVKHESSQVSPVGPGNELPGRSESLEWPASEARARVGLLHTGHRRGRGRVQLPSQRDHPLRATSLWRAGCGAVAHSFQLSSTVLTAGTWTGGATYDELSGLWFTAWVASGAGEIAATGDGGLTWLFPGVQLSGKPLNAIAASNYKCTAVASNGSGGLALYQLSTSPSWSSGLSITPVAMNLDTSALIFFNAASCYVALSGLSSGNSVSLWASSDGTADSHNLTSSLTSWGSHCGGCFVAQSPTTVLAVYSGVTAGTDAPHAATITGSSSGALTVTDTTASAPGHLRWVHGAGRGLQRRGRPLWNGHHGLDVHERSLTSPDGVNWNASGNLSGYGLPSGLACVGAAWLVAVPFFLWGTTYTRLIYATDLPSGNATWTWAEAPEASTKLVLYSNGRQAVAIGSTGLAIAFSDLGVV